MRVASASLPLRTSLARHLGIEDPGLAALKSATRAAIVMPAVFAFADHVIAQPQATLFSGFGSFSMLVLADFSGPPRTRLLSYLTLAGVGAVLITLGTLCSRSTLVATVATAAIGFTILYAGVISGYFAAGAFAALLSFIISVNIPAPLSAAPDRLEGWALACAAAISAQMLLWPPRTGQELRSAAARACAALADLLEAELHGPASVVRDREAAARGAVGALRSRFVATPSRPTGASGPTEALAFLVDELDWLLSVMTPATGDADGSPARQRAVDREAMAAAGAVLRDGAATLDGRDGSPDLERVRRAGDAVIEELVRQAAELPASRDDAALMSALEPAFRMRELSYAAWDVGANALLAAGVAPGKVERGRRLEPSAPVAAGRLAAEHARLRSVWFRNSIRGGAALAVAVLVAQQASVQHTFWVVLGTLSVLRSNALGTGATVLSALAGTAVGIVVGVGLILAIGTREPVLWAVLPFAVLLAAYAPRAVSFAAGQAGFTVVLVILFNIIQPTGWTVGLVRIEDVAIGFAISLVVGALFWPRGARSLVLESLAEAFARSAEYVAATVDALTGGGRGPAADAVRSARTAARAAAHRLDDAFRQFLAERGAERLDRESVGTLVAGATRVRLAGYSLLMMLRWGEVPHGGRCAGALDGEVESLRSWYEALGDALERSAAAPPPHPRDVEGGRRVLQCLREAVADGDRDRIRAAIGLVLASEHLGNLQRLESDLARPAAALSGRVLTGAAGE